MLVDVSEIHNYDMIVVHIQLYMTSFLNWGSFLGVAYTRASGELRYNILMAAIQAVHVNLINQDEYSEPLLFVTTLDKVCTAIIIHSGKQ